MEQVQAEQTPEESDVEEITSEEATDEELAAALAELREESDETGVPAPEQKAAPQPQPTPEPKKDDDVQTLKAEIAKLQQRVSDKERFIQRQATEVGTLRQRSKELEEKRVQLETALNERLGVDPVGAHKIQRALDQTEQELGMVQAQERTATAAMQNEQVIRSAIQQGALKEEDFDVNTMAETLAADGVAPATVQAFKANPYGVSADVAFHLAKRVKAEKAIKQVLPLIKQLVEENTKLKGKPSRMLDKVEAALKQKPQITGRKYDAQDDNELPSETVLSSLGDSELEALFEREKKKKR